MEDCKDCANFALCPWLQTSAKSTSAHYSVNGSVGDEQTTATTALVSEAREAYKGDDSSLQKEVCIDDQEDEKKAIQTYKRRWVMLAFFSLFSLVNAYMWIHLNIIGNVVLRFYNASLPADSLQKETAVDWLSLIYMLAYMVGIPLGMYILDRWGLRVNNVIGCVINVVGAWLKCAAAAPTRFPVLMAAQTLCGIAQVFIVSIPPRLAATWFGPNEVSTATAIGVFGNQVGVAVGFLLPPQVVPNSESLEDVGKDLGVMFFAGAAVCTLVLGLMLFVFQSAPPRPPSRAQYLMAKGRHKEHYFQSILRVIRNPSFSLLMISYGLNTGCYYAISTLLNSMVLYYFPGEEVNVGYIGLVIILTGIVGSVVAGLWLDRSKFFKSTSLVIYLLSALGMLAFTFTLDLGRIWIVFVTAGGLGFFMTGYLPVGYEFAAEITYPEPEGTSSGLLTFSAMFFGMTLTLGMRAMMNQVSILAANIFVSSVLIMGTIMTALVKAEYKRQSAENKGVPGTKKDLADRLISAVEHLEVDVKISSQ